MTKTVTIGSNRTFSNATTGKAVTAGLLQVGADRSRYTVKKNKAEAVSEGDLLGFGGHAWAEVGTKFTVEGNSSDRAAITFTGDYRTYLSALTIPFPGASTCRVAVSIVVRNVETGNKKQRKFRDETGKLWSYTTNKPENDPDSDYPNVSGFKETISKNLKHGETYFAGVRADAWATADGLASATADAYTDAAPHDGYITFKDITIDWNP